MSSVKLKQELVIDEFQKIWGNRFDYSEVIYVGTNTKVKIICQKHGAFWLYPWQHKRTVKPTGCYKCGRESAGKKVGDRSRSNTRDFVIKSRSLFGEHYDYSKVEYIHSHHRVIIGCPEHGDFMIEPCRHLEQYGCPTCSSQKSKVEEQWLDSIGLPKDQQHRNLNLNIDGSKCLVDGYDPSTNTVYEFHGDFWHGNPELYDPDVLHPMIDKTFGELYHRTLSKEEKIKSAGYNLITMWESNWNKLT